MAIEQTPLPREGAIPPGTLVWGSDFNAATALLYRWWNILDAPRGAAIAPAWENLFDFEPVVTTPELSAVGLEDIQEAAGVLRASEAVWSHYLDYDDIRLRWLAPDRFELEAKATVQRSEPDRVAERSCAYKALVRKRADGLLVFQRLSALDLDDPRVATFETTYVANRARATIVRFQAHMDRLSGRTDDMTDLMMPRLELHGLVASKRDESAGAAKLTDVNELRKAIAGSDRVADNVIRDLEGFAAWFATCTDLFTYGLHKLEYCSVKPLPDRRFETVAQFDWRAETLTGTKIETHQPLTWILVDTDEAYMRIEKLLPFG